MKKTLRKLAALIMAVIIMATCAVTAFAAGVTKSQAEEIALNHAGLTAKDVVMEKTEVDYERGKKVYEVEFFVSEGNGWYTEYDYTILASDGSVLRSKAEKDYDDDYKPNPPAQSEPNASGKDIGVEKAKELALAAFNLNAKDVKLVKAKKDYEDGKLVYEIEYREGYEKEYSCEVDAATGAVYDKDIDVNRTGFSRIEYFFECIGKIFYR